MEKLTRFGRRLPLPSTRQIRHELLAFSVQEETRLKQVALDKAKLAAPLHDIAL